MSAPGTLRAAIVGGTGYGGMELMRWLLQHPGGELTICFFCVFKLKKNSKRRIDYFKEFF